MEKKVKWKGERRRGGARGEREEREKEEKNKKRKKTTKTMDLILQYF